MRPLLFAIISLAVIACSKDKPAPIAPASKAIAATDVPAEPTNLRVEALTDTSAKVAWDAVEGATGYDLFYKTLSGPWINEPHRTKLWNIIYDLEPNTEYRWTVRAENKDGASKWVYGRKFRTEEEFIAVQSEPPTWIFTEGVSEADQAELREEMEHVRAFFARAGFKTALQ